MDPARRPDQSLCMRKPHKESTMQAPRTGWVIALTAIGSLMAALDTLVVSTALSTIQADLGASLEQLEWTVNAYNLSFAVLLMTGAALGDRFGRRRLYAVGLGAVRRRLGGLRARARRRLADRRPRRAGRGRGAADAARPGAAERRVPAREARRGDRHLQRDHRPRRGARAARRRRGRPGHQLAVDLLAQRPDRAGRDPARVRADAGELRPRHRRSTCPAWRSSRRGALGSSGGSSAATGRLGQPRGARRADRRRAAGSPRFVAWELRAREPMLPLRCSARARSARATRRSSSRSRRCSPACSSTRSSCRPGSGTTRSRPGCGCCRGRRRSSWSRRWPARSPTGSASGRCWSAGSLLQAAGMAWLALIAEPGHGVLADARAVAGRGRRRVDGDPGRAERGRRLGRAGGDRQGGRRQQHAARARRRVRHRDRGRGLRRRRRLRARPQAFVDGFGPAIGVAAALALAARSPRWRCRRRTRAGDCRPCNPRRHDALERCTSARSCTWSSTPATPRVPARSTRSCCSGAPSASRRT